MKKFFSHLTIIAIILFLAGCYPRGYLFTKTTIPLDINLSQTPIGSHHGKKNIKHFHYYVDAMWGSNTIGDIARQNKIETVYFADLETFSLLGIFNMYTVHVYGE